MGSFLLFIGNHQEISQTPLLTEESVSSQNAHHIDLNVLLGHFRVLSSGWSLQCYMISLKIFW